MAGTNKIIQNHLKKEYTNIRLESFYIVDFIKTDIRTTLIEKLKDLFDYDKITTGKKVSIHLEEIPDFHDSGVVIGSSFVNIGIILNKKYYKNHSFYVTKLLPDFLESIDLMLYTFDEKYYCICFRCCLHQNFKNSNLKNKFIHSGDMVEYEKDGMKGSKRRGPDIDDTINEYIKKTSKFLSDFIDGLYINKINYNKKNISNIPNIKILSIDNINFSNFKNWCNTSQTFLRFFDFDIATFSKTDNFVVSMQLSRSFGKNTTTSGLNFLFNFDDIEGKEGHQTKEDYVHCLIRRKIEKLLPFFYIYYLTNYHVESKIQQYYQNKKNLERRILSNDVGEETNFDKYEHIIKFYFDYNKYYFDKKQEIHDFNKMIGKKEYDFAFKPLYFKNNSTSDLIKNGTKELLNIEDRELENQKSEILTLKEFKEGLIDHYSIRENIKLQSKIGKLTTWTVILTIIIVVFTIFSFLKTIDFSSFYSFISVM
jgi:hypothetical protein